MTTPIAKQVMTASLVLLFGTLLTWPCRADVRLPAVLVENMVLQQGVPLRIWGWADDGEKVTVRLAGQEVTTEAREGRWSVTLKPLPAGGPLAMTVAGRNTIAFKSVMVGEVWICCGQSNMGFSLAGAEGSAEAIRQAGQYPDIRVFAVSTVQTDAPAVDVKGTWVPATSGSVGGFSAVAYYFGREINRTQKVPVGLIQCVAIMPCHAWVEKSFLLADPDLQAYATDALVHGGAYFNGTIAPLSRFVIRGAIYYQGEYDTGRAYRFVKTFPALIRSWRRAWGIGDFPFLYVQLAAFSKHDPPKSPVAQQGLDMPPTVLEALKTPGADSGWANLRQAQLRTLAVTNTGMAVAIDVGDPLDIHPKKKQPVGERLALWARANVYGEKIEYSGPIYESVAFQDGRAVVRFQHATGGLKALGDKLEGFAIAGADGNFVWAQATIDGQTVVVRSPAVAQPVAVRYGWADYPLCNLGNGVGLPASPFATDKFPVRYAPGRFTTLFPNPSFEQAVASSNQPAAWKTDGVVCQPGHAADGVAALHFPGGEYRNLSCSLSSCALCWTADLTQGAWAIRPGTIYAFSFAAAASGEATNEVVCLLNQGCFDYHACPVAGKAYRRLAIVGTRSRGGPEYQSTLDFRLFTKGELWVDSFEGIHWLRPELELSDAAPIDLGQVKPSQTKESAARAIRNSHSDVFQDATRTVTTMLYGASNVRTPPAEADWWQQDSDDVGAVIMGPEAQLFEFVTPHPGNGRQLKLIGPDGKPGLTGGPSPEEEPLVVRFLGSDQAGVHTATVRVCTQAGNVGIMSTGQPGEPLPYLFYVDIPVKIEVAP